MSEPPISPLLDRVRTAADTVRRLAGGVPDVAVVLGTGLGQFAETLEQPKSLPMREIPHWPCPTVGGHAGRVVVGRLHGRLVLVLAGRVHLYEGHDAATVAFPIRVLGLVGVRTLVLTNAVGGVNPHFHVGVLMVIEDHLNLTGANPLVGPPEPVFGSRFPDLTEVYAARLRGIAVDAARSCDVPLEHGIYAGVRGPSYETPAEVRALGALGADVVGMSTVCEAIAARQMDIEVLGLSFVANPAAGVTDRPVFEADVLAAADRHQPRLVALLEAIVERL